MTCFFVVSKIDIKVSSKLFAPCEPKYITTREKKATEMSIRIEKKRKKSNRNDYMQLFDFFLNTSPSYAEYFGQLQFYLKNLKTPFDNNVEKENSNT